MAATITNKRASLLLSNLSAIDTTLGFGNINALAVPASAVPSPLFSSATIASTASSSGNSPVQPLTPLQHPTPRRCSAANSAFMTSDADAEAMQVRARAPTPPRRPVTPLSPAVTRNIRPMSFFSDDSESETESPLSPYILSPTFQNMVLPPNGGLRSRWADLNKPPTPAPVAVAPPAPSAPTPTTNQTHAIRQWECRVPRYLPSGPATPKSASVLRSPVEEEIGALSQQITELHAHIAASEQMFKSGMMYVYIHQNAQAAALVHSPNLLQAPWAAPERENGDEEDDEPMTPEELVCMEGVKQTLRDRLEKEVNEVERRALRDLEMVRGVRHGLILEAEREAARERRRNLELELQMEMEREKEREIARAQRERDQQMMMMNDKMDIDAESDRDSGFSETLEAPIMLDVKSMTNSPVIAPVQDEIVFSFSTEEIDAAVKESLTTTTATDAPAKEETPSTSDDTASSSSSSTESSRTSSPEISLPPIKSISPKRRVPAPIKLASGTIGGSAAASLASPMMNIFRSPLSPCFSPLSPPMTAMSATFAMPLGSARMSVDFAAGLGFDMSGVNVGQLGNAAICA